MLTFNFKMELTNPSLILWNPQWGLTLIRPSMFSLIDMTESDSYVGIVRNAASDISLHWTESDPSKKKTTKKKPDSHCAAWAALNSFHFPNRICWSFTASWAYFWCLPGERGLPQRPKDRLTDSARRSQSRTAARLGKRMFCFLPALIRFDSIYLVGKHKGKFYMSRRAVTVFPLSIIL